MSSSRSLAAGLALIALVLASSSVADAPSSPAAKPVAVAQTEVPAAPADTVAPAPRLSPIMLEVRAAFDREREQIAALRLRLQQKAGFGEALALQREIERVKLDTEVAILRIQAAAARKAGRAALAERLEVAAKDLLAPPAPATPVTRPPRVVGR